MICVATGGAAKERGRNLTKRDVWRQRKIKETWFSFVGFHDYLTHLQDQCQLLAGLSWLICEIVPVIFKLISCSSDHT